MLDSDEPKKKTLYTITLSDTEMAALQRWCDKHLFLAYEVAYARFAFKGDDVNIVGYQSGKLVVQGKKTEDFVHYVLESEITKTPQMGYEQVLHPEWFEAHAGLDESGKGDLFGPLVSACVIADEDAVNLWLEKGLKESKRIGSDNIALGMDKMIRETEGVVAISFYLGMEKYNELYQRFHSNLNHLLAWMHARALEEALKKRSVPWGMLDQFTKQPLVQRYFKGPSDFDLRMQTKAEADPVVAAASIVARAEYIRQMRKLSKIFGEALLKGASAQVKEQGRAVVAKLGKEAFGQFAKLHFKTAYEVLGLPVPEKEK
ncbi:MAG: ribonuclease HIII [Verrucomicrobia bacterium GWF2_51_19]|nr:MAG: ribonuclease HIII [Verrucomicrobia bacterium GWF2_51_19]HCJ12111.1 ribonuclease HIII [Opitutae bacterium]